MKKETVTTVHGHIIELEQGTYEGTRFCNARYGGTRVFGFSSNGHKMEEIAGQVVSAADCKIERMLEQAVRDGRIVYDRQVPTNKPSELLALPAEGWMETIERSALSPEQQILIQDALAIMQGRGLPGLSTRLELGEFDALTDKVAVIHLGSSIVDLFERVSRDGRELVLKVRANAYVGGCEEDSGDEDFYPLDKRPE